MKKHYRVLVSSFSDQPLYKKAEFPPVEFTSITKQLSQLSNDNRIQCPKCGSSIDFNKGIEWYGPSHFICATCQKLVHVRRITIRSSGTH